MLHAVTTGAYYPPVDTTWKILTTGASQLTAGALCNVVVSLLEVLLGKASQTFTSPSHWSLQFPSYSVFLSTSLSSESEVRTRAWTKVENSI